MQEIKNTTFWALVISILLVVINIKFLSGNDNIDVPFDVKYVSSLQSKLDTIILSDLDINKSYELSLRAINKNSEVYKINPIEEFTLKTYNINSNTYIVPSRITQVGMYKLPKNVEFERLEKIKFYLNKENLINSEVELCYHTKRPTGIYLDRTLYKINRQDIFKNLKKIIVENDIDTCEFWQPPKFSLNNYDITVCRLFEFKHTNNKIIVSMKQDDEFNEKHFNGRIMIKEKGDITDSLCVEELILNNFGIIDM